MRKRALPAIFKKTILLNLLLLHFYVQLAQDKSPWADKPSFEVFGYVDIFYTYDFNQPTDTPRQSFFYNFNRHNEVNLNLGLIVRCGGEDL